MITPSIPLSLTSEDKQDALRHLDHAGPWQSLDDQRYCLRCGHVISGRQIVVMGGTRPFGPLHLECPTPECAATPNEWIMPVHRRKRISGRSAKPEGLERPARKSKGWFGHAAYSGVHFFAEIATDCRSVLGKLRPFPSPRFSSLF